LIAAQLELNLAAMFIHSLYAGAGSDLGISEGNIGYLSGVSPQRMDQVLTALERASFVRIKYCGIVVLDLADLRNWRE
jgi:hypothetical protein